MAEEINSSRVTMRTLAEKLGVTKATVSLALRKKPGVSESTRNRILRLAEELNYRPDPAISAIAASRWNHGCSEQHRVIAFFCHRHDNWKIYQEGYIRAIQDRAKDYGYKVEPFLIEKYPTAKAVERVLDARGIRGIIIPQIPNAHSKRIMNLNWSRFTAVCCGIGRVRPALHTVSDNIFMNVRMMWEVARSTGSKRIGAILHLHDPVAEDDWTRLGASLAAEVILGIPVEQRIPPMIGAFNNDEAIYAWFKKYEPEVVIGFNYSTGEALERKGIRFPEDAEFMALIVEEDHKWSGFHRPCAPIAKTAVDLLVAELRENHWGLPRLPRFILVTPEWNKGETFTGDITIVRDFLDSQLPSQAPEISKVGD